MNAQTQTGWMAACGLVVTVGGLAAMGAGIVPGATVVAAILTAALWTALAWRSSGDNPPGSLAVAWMGVVCLSMILLTSIPLPVGWKLVQGALRTSQNLYAVTFLENAVEQGLPVAPPGSVALTRNLAGTLRMLVLLAAAWSAGMLAAHLPVGARWGYLRCLAWMGAVVAVAGFIGQWIIPQGDTLWWIIPVPHTLPGPVACFVNRNHFGGWLALLSIPVLVLLVHDLAARRYLHALPAAVAVALMLPVLVLSQSRGALCALVAGLVVTGVFCGIHRRPLMGVLLPAAGILLLVLVLWFAPAATRDRWVEVIRAPRSVASIRVRVEAWRDTIEVWHHYPWVGVGANALRMAYPQYRQSSHSGELTHAENQYLQLAAETGILGIILALAGALVVLRGLIPRPGGGNALPPALTIVAVGALTVSAVHALYDFPQHVPLYAVVMASLAGLGFPVKPGTVGSRAARPAGSRWRQRLPPACVLGMSLAVAPAAKMMHQSDALNFPPTATLPELAHAISAAPISWQAWYEFGRRVCNATERSWETLRLGENAILRAAELNPNNYRLWLELGRLRMALGDRQGARIAFDRVQALRDWVRLPIMENEPPVSESSP